MKKLLLALGIAAMACSPIEEKTAPVETVDAGQPILEQRVAPAVESYDNSRGQYGYIAVTGTIFWAHPSGQQFVVSSHYGGMKVTLGCEQPSGPQPGPYSTLEQVAQELRLGRTVEVAVPRHNIAMLGHDQSLDSVCPGAIRFDVDYTPLAPGDSNWREQALREERDSYGQADDGPHGW